MKRIAFLALISAVAMAACGESAPESQPEARVEPSPETSGCEELPLGTENYPPRQSPTLEERDGEVLATANIYAAGLEAPPAPGGGGGGTLPPVVELPAGSSRIVTFPEVTGRVNPITGEAEDNGPEGDGIGPTDVKSLGGISGVVHRTNGLFLVGVFLTDDPPADPSPPRLNFTDPNLVQAETDAMQVPEGDQFGELAPEVGQVFFIGDGKGRSYVVPDEATRLFLAFDDAFAYVGCPGWYGNNSGKLTVTVDVTEG